MKVECIIGILFSVTVIAISGDPDDGSPADSPHPDTLPLAFTVGQDRVVVNLTRTAVVTDQIPIYLGDDSGTIQPWSDDQNETFLVFTDDVTMATFILRETTDPEGQMSRQLRGTFDNEGELYSLEPFEVASSRMKRTLEDPAVDDADSLDEEVMTTDIDDVTYTVSRLNRTKLLDMQHDAVIRDDIEAINREPERILSDIGNDPLYPGRIPYEVELFLVLDYSVYRSWLEYSNYNEADAISNMRFYFIHILSGVNARYRGIRESDMEIYLDPVGIYIARTPGASAFTEDPSIKQGTRYTEAYDALDAFEEWINDKVNELPPFDQATLFTKNYLFSGLRSDGSRRRINGLANIQGVCQYRRATINYDSGPYGSVQTAAHGLGHNLGAYHDGYDNECVSRDQFIMATSPGALTDTTRMNPFHFSHCSIRAFRDYLNVLRVNETNCLLHNAHTGDIYDYEYNLRAQPGQQFDVHAQCKLLFGSSSYYCGGGRYDTMLCQEMRCWDANLRQCLQSVEQRAAEGTTCGNYMWCSNGECVHDRSAPSTETDTCIYGDYRGVVDPQTKWTCEDVTRYAPWRCNDEDLCLDCCASCSELPDTERTVHREALGQLQFVVDPVSGVTFSLYDANQEWTWVRAYNHCVSVGERLAVIDNSTKQEAVNNFTEKGHAWIGGRRSPDVIWRWISGEEYEYDDADASEDSGRRCGAIGRLSSPSVHPSECVIDSGPLPAVCQQLAQGASKRYWVTDTHFTSWNDARAFCLDQGGDLAHPSSQEPIQDWTAKMVDLIVDSVSFVWIGLSRHSWSWVTGDHTTLQAYRSMTYTHFATGEGDETSQTCAHLDMKGNNDISWADKPCEFPSRYFVCDDGPPLTTTSQPEPAPPTQTPSGAEIPHRTEGGLSTAGTADPVTDVTAVYRMLWVTVGVCGVIMVAVIVIFTICWIKVRRLQKALQAAKVNEPVVTPPDSQLAAWSGDNEGSSNNQRASQLESHGQDPYERVGDGASSVAMATFPVIRPPAELPSSSRDSGGSYGTIRTSQIESSDPESYERHFEGAYDDTVAMVTVPVITPPAELPSSSRDEEGSYNNLRASQIESRDPEPYERLGDGAHYDLVGDPETGVEGNGGRHIYLHVE